MSDDNKSIPLRVRITPAEERDYKAAMEKLGLLHMSTYVRWALNNTTAQVLRPVVTPKPVAPKPKPKRVEVPAPAPAQPVNEFGVPSEAAPTHDWEAFWRTEGE